MAYLDKLNNKNLFDDYKLIIQTGTEALLEFPERKEGLSNDWREENGTEYDLDLVRFKDKEISLSCIFIADNDTDYWTRYNAFFTEITKPGYQQLFIYDHSKTYEVFYKKTSAFKKLPKRLKNVNKVFVKFTLTLQVQ